jgi:hypothetical protein
VLCCGLRRARGNCKYVAVLSAPAAHVYVRLVHSALLWGWARLPILSSVVHNRLVDSTVYLIVMGFGCGNANGFRMLLIYTCVVQIWQIFTLHFCQFFWLMCQLFICQKFDRFEIEKSVNSYLDSPN